MAKHQSTVSAGTRLYYFDVREDTEGSEYLTITEVNTRTKERNCIYLHAENIEKFRKAFEEISQLIKNDSER